jgi:hypothetical protein
MKTVIKNHSGEAPLNGTGINEIMEYYKGSLNKKRTE